MQIQRTTMPYSTTTPQTSWLTAYKRFLLSKDESMVLKVAPLALMGILPVEIITNLVPIIGELDDIGYIVALAVVVVKTANRVRKYR